MLSRRNNKDIDKKKVNEILDITNKILKVIYILLFIVCLYIITIVSKEWQILTFIITFLKIIFPLFMGIVIAWLFEPLVKSLCKKRVKRIFSVVIVYALFLSCLALILGMIVPLLSEQINDFVVMIPEMIDNLKLWLSDVLKPLAGIEGFDLKDFEKDLFSRIGTFGIDLMNNLPTLTVSVIKVIVSGFGTILVSLVIGFSAYGVISAVKDFKKIQKNY